MSDFVGRTLGPYKLENLLGKGGMASVYRAYQASVKRYVAIKVMAPEIGDQPGFVERFAQEAEVIASLEHPHIVPVIDYGTDGQLHYLVMRYIEGGSLEDFLRKGKINLPDAAKFLSQMASALSYAHKRGVVHRDLKPNNMLLDTSDNLYLTDFGIARLMQSDHHLTATGSVMGTPAYMSPEQGLGQRVDARSDIYTLGVVLYEMVLNRLPFAAETPAAMIFQHVYEKPAPPQKVNPELPDAVAGVLNKAMAKNPDDRYQSANDLAAAFSEAIHSKTVTPYVEDPEMAKTYVGNTVPPIPAPGPINRSPAPPSPPTNRGRGTVPSPVSENMALAGGGRRFPIPLLAGLAVAAVILIGGLIFLVGKNNSEVAAQQTSTTVAMIALSATATATNTSTPTATATTTYTPTATFTASATSTPLPTRTPNTALTQFAQQMALTGTAQQIEAATQTQAAIPTAVPTSTRTPVPTEIKIVPTPILNNTGGDTGNNSLSGDPASVIAQLVAAGAIPNANGTIAMSADKINVLVTKAKQDNWERIDTSTSLTNFVMSATFSWDAQDTHNECGVMVRYKPADQGKDNMRYYLISLSRAGTYQVYARDETGYRDSTLVNNSSSLINADNNATNQLLVIGQGSHFSIYVNGKAVDGFDDSTYPSGQFAVVGTRFEQSQGLLCKFRNVWVWDLK